MESKNLHSQEKKPDFWLSEAGAKDDGGTGWRVSKGTKFQLYDKQVLRHNVQHPSSSVQSLSRVRLCDPVNRSTPGLPVYNRLPGSPKPLSIESLMPSNLLILCRPLLLLPSIFPSIKVFSKYWSFSFSISPSNEHPGLISFRMDWLDLLAVQGTLKSLLRHRSSA